MMYSSGMTLIGTLSAVNEAVIAHEDDDQHVTGSLMDVVEAVENFVGFFTMHGKDYLAAAIPRDELALMVKTILVAANVVAIYRRAIESAGTSFVGLDTNVLEAAVLMTSAVMDHIEELA